MPEFHLEGADAPEFSDLSPFVQGFIEAAFFTETASGIPISEWFDPENQEDIREGRADGCLPSDSGFEELHVDALREMIAFCEAFQAKAADLLSEAYERDDYSEEQAGRDLWFTYNGHGTGYWDRKQLEAGELGEALSKACGRGEWYLWFGDHVTLGGAPFVHAQHS